ncbi:MAG: hypothetical protein Q8Q09_21640 [Deltaproteobacteria bacterium]|nr:hypothetical protein [Deltaproteobacteria bacterium]
MSGPSVIAAKIALLTHAVTAGVLLGSLTHLWLVCERGAPRAALKRTYASVALTCWGILFALGAVMYPRYRVHVRAEQLDVYARWAAKLFDLKENLALIAGVLLFAVWFMRSIEGSPAQAHAMRWCVRSAALIVWFVALSGLLVTSVSSV